MALDGQAHLNHAPAHQNDTHGFDETEDETGQVGNDGDGSEAKALTDRAAQSRIKMANVR